MTEENDKPQSKGGAVAEGLTLQAFGNGLATLFVLYKASQGHYFPPAFEIALGSIMGGTFYAVWKLFGRRVMRWARGK